ncbi:MAG: SusF/SusE family outer membrane protein, partial [Flavobacteriaceae bacterium]|nr:SusF/SusE family outer membrane protein [Flavobacteriaceae bacterium]
ITVLFTPYTVEYDELFLVGSITDPQWSPEDALPMNRLDFNLFEITIDLVDGDEFKFLPTNTGWDGDIGEDPDNAGFLIDEGEANLSGYSAGKYTITVDLNTFTFVIEELLAPEELYLVGSLTGWDPATSLPFFNSAENVFTVVADLPDGAEFKFLPQNTGWDGDWGEDPDNLGSIIQDGEQNVSGYPAGKYLITVDYNTLTYKLSSIDNLFLVGSLTGWDPGTSLAMGEASLGVFSTIVDLPDGAEFKFLPQNTGWDGDWGKDASNSGRIIQDGEQNLSGYAAGKYVVAVDFNTLSFTVSSVSEVPASLYLVGGFNGWSNDAGNPQFTESSTGVFEITQALSAGDEFKFVPVAGDWGNDWGESKVSSRVLEQNDEKNLSVSDTGTYTITVNFNKGTISVVN